MNLSAQSDILFVQRTCGQFQLFNLVVHVKQRRLEMLFLCRDAPQSLVQGLRWNEIHSQINSMLNAMCPRIR